VIEARRAELVPKARAQPFVFAEDDRGDDGAPLTAHTRGQRARDRAADPVGDPT
jgi:hypothetical protein